MGYEIRNMKEGTETAKISSATKRIDRTLSILTRLSPSQIERHNEELTAILKNMKW